jgi:GTPase SAR1 family protein
MIFSLWDLGGSQDARAFWRFYYEDTQAIIFVVDSSDLARMVSILLGCARRFREGLPENNLGLYFPPPHVRPYDLHRMRLVKTSTGC